MLRLVFGTLLFGVSIQSAVAAGTSPLADSREEYTACVVAAVDDMVAAYPATPTDEILTYANAECYGITSEESMKALDPMFRAVLNKISRPTTIGNDFIEPETKEAASTSAIQPSKEAQANVSASATTPPPVPVKAAKKQYNPVKLTIQSDVPACRWMRDHDKWINLISAGRRDLADRLDCVEIPAGEHVIFLDEVNSMRQVHWEHDGTEFQGWLIKGSAINDFDVAVSNTCSIGSDDYSDCFHKLLEQFERVNY